MKNDDVELIQQVLAGDESAFAELVKKYQKPVHALAWRKIGDFHIAEEITQDAFLRAYQKLGSLKDPNQFSGWLYVIATRRCYAWLRKKRIRTQPLEDAETTMGQKDAYSRHVVEQRAQTAVEAQRDVVKQLLAKLKESERTVMTLHYLGEMTVEEISKFLGVSAGTIKSRLQRARHRLQKEEIMIREALDHFQISPNLTDNIMREVARLKPAAPSASKLQVLF
ncbi:RNA polymerase sigma factor [Candidatus Poribacteria bacterium]|nr:RNA polymerase sigma factor [Candidatus Poribacteria bacterium]